MMIVLLGSGFEEIEALATVDLLRRAGLEVKTAGIGGRMITGGHGIPVQADLCVEDVVDPPELLILPGGLGGVEAMEGSVKAMGLIQRQMVEGHALAAICAAPAILGRRGWADGRRVTCYPGFESQMGRAICVEAPVVVDGALITGRSAGAAVAFALAIVEQFCGREQRDAVAQSIVSEATDAAH